MMSGMENKLETITEAFLAEARRELSRKGGQARARQLQALKDAAAAGDPDAQRELRKIKRTARKNGRKGGRPRKDVSRGEGRAR